MMIILQTDATRGEIGVVVERIEVNGLHAHLVHGEERTVIVVVGDGRSILQDQLLHLPGVDQVIPISRPFTLASRELITENSFFPLDGFQIGAQGIVMIAGQCSVEDRSQLLEAVAHKVETVPTLDPAAKSLHPA
jgi:3-deoxy-7-phosphoheptulonate synthase